MDNTLAGQPLHGVVEERFADGHVDMNRAAATPTGSQQGLIDEPIAVPSLLVIVGFGQVHGLADESSQCSGLGKRLPVQLIDPLCRPVGRHHDERQMLVTGLGHGRSNVEQGRPRRDTHHHRLAQGLANAQCIEARRPLVGDRIARQLRANGQIMDDGRVAAAGTNHGMAHAMAQ